MANFLDGLSKVTTKALSLSNLILVTPQETIGYSPQNPPRDDGTTSTAKRPPSIVFHYETSRKVILQSEITDHYVEDNTSRQDQIALKPVKVSTKGYIGELNDVPPPGLAILKTAAERLTVINAFAPQISTTASLAYAEAFFLYQSAQNIANSAVAAWSSIGDALTGGSNQTLIDANGITIGSNQNRQQVAFQQFYGYWANRVLFTVQTPWGVFDDMAIEQLTATEDEETNVITDFEISFKMFRTAKTAFKSSGLGALSLDGRAASQGASAVDLGTSSPVKSIGLSGGLSGMGLA